MGYAKYHEDDLEIFQDRMYFRDSSDTDIVQTRYTEKPKFAYYCPICHQGIAAKINVVAHILETHGKSDFLFVNSYEYDGELFDANKIYSATLYCFREEPTQIKTKVRTNSADSWRDESSFWTKPGEYEYNVLEYLPPSLYTIANITTPDSSFNIRQAVDISAVSLDSIVSGRHKSGLFDDQVSAASLTLQGYQKYIRMLIHEGESVEEFMDFFLQLHLKGPGVDNIIWCFLLAKGEYRKEFAAFVKREVWECFKSIINSDLSQAISMIEQLPNDNEKQGLLLIIGYISGDINQIDFSSSRYASSGIIGNLAEILRYFYYFEEGTVRKPYGAFNEISLFDWPLITTLLNVEEAINAGSSISFEDYQLLRSLSSIVPVCYLNGISDESTREKVLKSAVKLHSSSQILKQKALNGEYNWIPRRIRVGDKSLYTNAVLKEGKDKYSDVFLKQFPFDDKVQITPLGGEDSIGASCFIISYMGYNIMLDCGIDPRKNGDDAYPRLDEWDKHIDAIIITHAHIDHCGALPKAHAMWPGAKMFVTRQTGIFLKYIFADMARVKNGIVNDFEIENVSIESSVMESTLKNIVAVDFGKWISIGKDIKVRLHTAGHIVGAAYVELMIAGKRIVYTGDFCEYSQMLAGSADFSNLGNNIDYLITEATYVSKKTVDWDSQLNEIKRAIIECLDEKKAILLPSSAIGRAQELMCIVGEMYVKGEIPSNIELYLGGMAIPAITQIIPFMNGYYKSLVEHFQELNYESIPKGNSIVIASSASMKKGTASYKIAKAWDELKIKYKVITAGYLDEETDINNSAIEKNYYGRIKTFPLSTHASVNGIKDLIARTSPKVISFVHRGNDGDIGMGDIKNDVVTFFNGDVVDMDLKAGTMTNVFDLYSYLVGGC